MAKLIPYANVVGRLMIAAIFLMSGLGKISSYVATQEYMEAMHVPGILLPAVILVEVAGSLAVIVGWQTRIAAFALAGFTLLSAVLFHANLGDQTQFIMFWKNIAMTGGLLFLVANGPGILSFDTRR